MVLSIAGLSAVVLGFLKSSAWGWVQPKPSAPVILGLSPVVWLIAGGLVVIWLLLGWLEHREARGREPLFRRELLRNRRAAARSPRRRRGRWWASAWSRCSSACGC